MLVPGRGKGERGPGTRAGQAIGPTTGEAAAPAPGAPTGCPVAPRAIWGWSITPTMMASAPAALSAKVAAWANIVFMRSEEHTSELQSLMRISYAVFCLKTQNTKSHNQ